MLVLYAAKKHTTTPCGECDKLVVLNVLARVHQCVHLLQNHCQSMSALSAFVFGLLFSSLWTGVRMHSNHDLATPDDHEELLLCRQTAQRNRDYPTKEEWRRLGSTTDPNYSILAALGDSHRNPDGLFMFKLLYPSKRWPNFNVWKQASNPMTIGAIKGYIPISINVDSPGTPFKGLEYSTEEASLLRGAADGSGPWFAVGQVRELQGGIRAEDPNIVTNVELYALQEAQHSFMEPWMPRHCWNDGEYDCIPLTPSSLDRQSCEAACKVVATGDGCCHINFLADPRCQYCPEGEQDLDTETESELSALIIVRGVHARKEILS